MVGKLRFIFNPLTGNLDIVKEDSPLSFDPNTESYFFDDFFIGTTEGLGWVVTASGTGASAQQTLYGADSTEKAIGILELDTGGTSSGRCSLTRSINGIAFGYYSIEQTWRFALEELSDATNRYVVYAGFVDNLGAGVSVDGCYFVWSDSLGPNWLCVTRNGNVQTTTDSGVAANTLYNVFKIIVNDDASEVQFFINSTLVATHTTNIPGGSGRQTGIGAYITKLTGSNKRELNLDYYYHKIKIPGGRD